MHGCIRVCLWDVSSKVEFCRWSKDRYEGAVASLVHILRVMQATSPHACVLRPALREEARKAIGALAHIAYDHFVFCQISHLPYFHSVCGSNFLCLSQSIYCHLCLL